MGNREEKMAELKRAFNHRFCYGVQGSMYFLGSKLMIVWYRFFI